MKRAYFTVNNPGLVFNFAAAIKELGDYWVQVIEKSDGYIVCWE